MTRLSIGNVLNIPFDSCVVVGDASSDIYIHVGEIPFAITIHPRNMSMDRIWRLFEYTGTICLNTASRDYEITISEKLKSMLMEGIHF